MDNMTIGYVRREYRCWGCDKLLGTYNGYDGRAATKALYEAHYPWKCTSSSALAEQERVFKETDESAMTCEANKPPRPMTIEEFDLACEQGAQVLEAQNRAKFAAMTDKQKETLKQLAKKKPPK